MQLRQTENGFTLTDTSPVARGRMVAHLRKMAALIEDGAEIERGGLGGMNERHLSGDIQLKEVNQGRVTG